jgi:hypothetical protein
MKLLDKAIFLNYLQMSLFITLIIISVASLLASTKAKADCDQLVASGGYNYRVAADVMTNDYRQDALNAEIKLNVECEHWDIGFKHTALWNASSVWQLDKKYQTVFFVECKIKWSL